MPGWPADRLTPGMNRTRSRWSGLALAQVLSLLFFAACLWWIAREVNLFLANDRITSSLSLQRALGSRLGLQLGAFATAGLLVHALFGFLVFALARLTEVAFPGASGARRGWWICGWFILLAGLALAINTTFFPSSLFAGDDSWWRNRIAGLPYVAVAAVMLACGVVLLLVRVVPRPPWHWNPGVNLRAASVATAAAALLLVLWIPRTPAVAVGGATARPDIIILGIDSLRNDLTIPKRGPADAPAIREFLQGARRFDDATTPLARTYPSWMSILTGRHPVSTNARYNLMPRHLVHEGETLGDALRAHGYRSIYATDEVRYANFDRSFGFDQTVTPPVGAIDFLLGYAGDMPLINLVVSTPFGGALFPSNKANRAAYVTYQPRDFVRRLEREIRVEGPAFLAIHLTLAHWPYSWAGKPKPTVPNAYRVSYEAAVHEVDRQFSGVMKMLAEKGVLDNAIVVLLSDHGEALGGENDSIIRQTGSGREIWDSMWGHGTSVLSPNQYRVVLAMRAFGRAKLPGPDLNYGWPVSVEDLRPTLEELATGVAPSDVDGLSLVPFMSEPSRAVALARRIRFTETDFNTVSIMAGHYAESGVIDEAAAYYELDPESGWVQLREPRIAELIAQKQRAALSHSTLLAAIPALTGAGPRYITADRLKPEPRSFQGPPAASLDPETRRLWDALQARFPGELTPAAGVPRM